MRTWSGKYSRHRRPVEAVSVNSGDPLLPADVRLSVGCGELVCQALILGMTERMLMQQQPVRCAR